MKKYLLFLFAITFLSANAQKMLEFEPIYYQDSTGKLYWNRFLPVYISLSPSKNGSGVNLESKKYSEYDNPFYLDTEGQNFIRTRWAVNKDTKKPVVPQMELKWEVYADGIAPSTQIILESENAVVKNGVQYFDGKLMVSFKSKDAVSGVKAIYYSVNGEAYKKYTKRFSVNQNGDFKMKYFAVDNVNNVEIVKTKGVVKEKAFIVDTEAPSSNCVVTGVNLGDENIVSLTTKMFLESKDKSSGVNKIYYRFDDGAKKLYTTKTNIPLTALKDGNHILKFFAIDKVGNQETEQQFKFYLDRTAPITISDVLGDKFIVGEKVYFSGRTKMKITSVDNKSGVKEILYSIDGSKYQSYSDPFYLPSVPGRHVVKYYSLDNTDNVTENTLSPDKKYQYRMKVDKIYVDLTGPSLDYSFLGNKFGRKDTIFINKQTKVKLSATDAESGTQKITYALNEVLKETLYSKPFTFSNSPSGLHKVNIFGYDNVNNRNLKVFYVIVDASGPEVDFKFSLKPLNSKNGLNVYPNYCAIFLTAQDDLTGIKQIYYQLNGGKKQLYSKFIKGFKIGENSLLIEAYDKLGNKTKKSIKFFVK